MTDTDTTVNYARAFISRICQTCGATFDLDPALYKRRRCFLCSPATTRPVLPPPAAELRVPWTAEREARGAAPDRGPRCLARGCAVRFASGPSRACPDHRDEAEDQPPLGTADPRLAALPDAPVLTPAERAARRARLAQANEQLLRDRGPGFHVPKAPPQPRPATRARAGCATATASALPPRCTVASEVRPAALQVLVIIYDGSLVRMTDTGNGELLPSVHRSHSDRRAAARLALARDWARSDKQVAADIGSGYRLVAHVRAELAAAGEIPDWHPDAPGRYPWKGEAARAALLADWRRSNMAVGKAAGCSHRIVAKIRLELELSGVIPRWRGAGSPAGYRRPALDCKGNTQPRSDSQPMRFRL